MQLAFCITTESEQNGNIKFSSLYSVCVCRRAPDPVYRLSWFSQSEIWQCKQFPTSVGGGENWRYLTFKRKLYTPPPPPPSTTSSYFFASVELCKLANKNTCLRGTPCSYNFNGVVFAELSPRRKNPSTNPPTSQWKQVVLLPQESPVKTVVDFARSTRYYCTCTLKHSHVPKESKDVLWN